MINAIDTVKSRRDLSDFINFPYLLHKGQESFVPPLVSEVKDALSADKNPFYQHASIELFLARKNGKVVGRIASIVDKNFIEAQGQKIGLFGFFECIDDNEVANSLFERATQDLKEKKMQMMLGPSNPSMNDEIGILIDAFDLSPAVKMVWNPPYYHALLENAGLKKAMDVFAWDMHEDDATDRLKRMGLAILKRSKVNIRKVNMKRFREEVETFRQVYNAAWSDNWGFVPWTKEEFEHAADSLKQIVDPDIVLIAEDQGRPVAFSLGIPDINLALKHTNGRLFPFGLLKLLYYSRKINRIRIPILGVIKEYRGRGIDTALYYETFRIGTGKGYHSCEMSWILEDNVQMNRAAEMMGARKYKTYRLYEKSI